MMAVLAAMSGKACYAESISEVLAGALAASDKLKIPQADLESAEQHVKEAWGGWYPSLYVSADTGHDRTDVPEGPRVHRAAHQDYVSVTQTLWDFGASNALIDRAKTIRAQAEITVEATRQSVILECAAAYVNLIRSYDVSDSALKADANAKKRIGFQNAKVAVGAAASLPVLQAKSQIAGTEARSLRARGALQEAQNRFRTNCASEPEKRQALVWPRFSANTMPPSLDDAIDAATSGGTQGKLAALSIELGQETASFFTAKAFGPLVQARLESIHRDNISGIAGYEREQTAKIVLTFPFNLGFTAVNTINAAESDLRGQALRAAQTRKQVEETVRNSWKNLEILRENAEALHNQAEMSAQMLDLTRKRGSQSVIELVATETAFANAASDAMSADADVLIAAYTLLWATGSLATSMIE